MGIIRRKMYKKHNTSCEETSDGKPAGPVDAILSSVCVTSREQKDTSSENKEKINGIVIGKFVGCSSKDVPLVDYSHNATFKPLPALAIVSITANDAGRDVALGFLEGNPLVPVILGFIHQFASSNPSPISQ